MPEINIEISKKSEMHHFHLSGDLKFYADSFSKKADSFDLLLKGINFNFNSLDPDANFKSFIDGYQKLGVKYLDSLRGSLCGAIYDKRKQEYIIFTNHVGDQKLYYTETVEAVYVSADIFELVSILRKKSSRINLNRNAAYALLSYGYLIDDMTLVSEIKRIPAGHYLYIDREGKTKLVKYFSLSNQPVCNRKESDVIEELDQLFRNAVKKEFEKDTLYGLKHLSSLSGGLDCRMTNWVAKHLGNDEVNTFTFSQYGYLDMTIAHEIASFLNYEWIFKSLDPGNYLTNIDEMVHLTNAQISYSGSAHAQSMMRMFNQTDFGLIHTGQLGDVTVGTYSPVNAYSPASVAGIKASSNRLLHKVEVDWTTYENCELATYQIRGLNGILTGNFVSQVYTEVASPFLDVDFLNFVLSIPITLRAYHKIYKQWIIEKYPEAAQFKWESINAKITDRTIRINHKMIPVKQLLNFIYEGIRYRLRLNIKECTKYGMNPFEYWYKHNQRLSDTLNTYFNKHVDLIRDDELKQDCELLFSKGTIVEKMLTLTFLSAIKQLDL